MERNEFPDNSTQGQSGGSSAGNNFGTGTGPGAPGYVSDSGSSDAHGLTDRARDIAGTAQEKLADVGSTVRDRAGSLKDTLADALESGADKLRQRGGGQSTSFAGATGGGSTAIEGDGRLTEVTTKVATGMDATAGWLRDADIEGLKSGLEKQVKEHPGRTLLIAAGLGYLLGKALRK
jgi:ElaB/YqjD/DUF883 family membrane-anchored ribosome-binding protein